MKVHAPEELYHVYNRGMQKQAIFSSDADRFRFLFLILVLQGTRSIPNMSRSVKQSVQSRTLNIESEIENRVTKSRMVELVHFCLMPNHFHLLLREKCDGGIAKYMQRVLTAYTKYFNVRHGKSGHLFQGSYKSVHVADDEQLMHLSAYIHKNPCELPGWRGNEHSYYWSSYMDCLDENRFGNLLDTSVVTDRYSAAKGEYKTFVRTSPAKDEVFKVEL